MIANVIQDLTVLVGRIAAGLVGAAVGYVVTAAAMWFLFRMTVNRQPPRPARRVLRGLGAIGGALAAVLFLPVGYGGFGLGSGGLGLGPGGGGFTPSSATVVEPAAAPAESPKPEPKPSDRTARVIMLGGPLVRGEAFYRWGDEESPRTLAEIQTRLRTRMDADPPATSLDIVIYFEDSLARQSSPVHRLADWAAQAGLSVRIVPLPGRIPRADH